MDRLPLDVNLNDNAKTAVVAIATAVIAFTIMNSLRIIFGKSRQEPMS